MKMRKCRFFKIIGVHILIGIVLICSPQISGKNNQYLTTSKEELMDDHLKKFQNDEYMKRVYDVWINIPNHQNYTLFSSMSGEICGTYGIENYVYLLIDKTIKNNKDRSLLIIYKNDTSYKSQWLIKNEDLSNMVISKNSGNIRLYCGDLKSGSSRICWSKRNSKFYITKK